MRTLVVGALLLTLISWSEAAHAYTYWDGYRWVERCGPECQARREHRMREERWREHRWEEWHNYHYNHPLPPPGW